jgi:hypothetical protein
MPPILFHALIYYIKHSKEKDFNTLFYSCAIADYIQLSNIFSIKSNKHHDLNLIAKLKEKSTKPTYYQRIIEGYGEHLEEDIEFETFCKNDKRTIDGKDVSLIEYFSNELTKIKRFSILPKETINYFSDFFLDLSFNRFLSKTMKEELEIEPNELNEKLRQSAQYIPEYSPLKNIFGSDYDIGSIMMKNSKFEEINKPYFTNSIMIKKNIPYAKKYGKLQLYLIQLLISDSYAAKQLEAIVAKGVDEFYARKESVYNYTKQRMVA